MKPDEPFAKCCSLWLLQRTDVKQAVDFVARQDQQTLQSVGSSKSLSVSESAEPLLKQRQEIKFLLG